MLSPTYKTVAAAGIDLAYAEGGEGRPVVFLHGAMSTLEDGLIGLYPTLSARFRMLAFDRPGHGGSPGAFVGSIWRQAAILHEAFTTLGLERPVLIGHSHGGAVAMAYALRFPSATRGVVAVAPIAFPEPRLEQFLFGMRAVPVAGDWLSILSAPLDEILLPALWSGMFLPQVMTPAFSADFPFAKAARRADIRADSEESVMMGVDLARSAAQYANCAVPVRVLQGDRDIVVNPRLHGRGLAALAPRGEFISLPGLGHMAHHFAPDAVADAVDAVLEASA